jgi:hypothetical protein
VAEARARPTSARHEASRNPGLDALWERVLEAWDDDKTHAALLEHAVLSGALPELAARYKELSGDPEKGVLAKKRLDAIVQTATQMLLSTRMPRPGRIPLPITLSAVGVCLALIVWVAYELLSRGR